MWFLGSNRCIQELSQPSPSKGAQLESSVTRRHLVLVQDALLMPGLGHGHGGPGPEVCVSAACVSRCACPPGWHQRRRTSANTAASGGGYLGPSSGKTLGV